MLVSLKEYRDKSDSFRWFHDGSEYSLEASDGRWVMYQDGVIVRDSYGHPAMFFSFIDGKYYARDVLGHKLD